MTDGLPDLVIAGFPKAGTSTLYQWLYDHPDVGGPAGKEAMYFLDRDALEFDPKCNFLDFGEAGYKAFFQDDKCRTAKLLIEGSPAYAVMETALTHLPTLSSKPHIVFVVREPSAQIFSTHKYFSNTHNHLPPGMDFVSFIKAAKAGDPAIARNELCRDVLINARYIDHLAKWHDRLGERMSVFVFEEMVRADKRVEFMKALAARFGLDPGFYDSYAFPTANESYVAKHAGLNRLLVPVRNAVIGAIGSDNGVYRAARNFYRTHFTTTKAEKSDAEQQLLDELKAQYKTANEELAGRFKLDLSAWN